MVQSQQAARYSRWRSSAGFLALMAAFALLPLEASALPLCG